MIIKVKLNNRQRHTYGSIESLITYLPRVWVDYFTPSKLYGRSGYWVNPRDHNQVEYFDEYDIRLPHHEVVAMIDNIVPVKYSYPTIQYGYKRRPYRGYRRPRHKQGLINGLDLPTAWDDKVRSSYYNRNWKQFRKTQYHEDR